RGLSGPAILQISSFWKPGESIQIDAMPDVDGPRPAKRFLQKFQERYGPKPELLHDWRVIPKGTEGYGKAEVTVGGVDTTELSSKSMEAKKVPGLFFIGEVVDVTGELGGHNFEWAWASGFAAGRYV